MDIAYACKTIRAWRDILDPNPTRRVAPGSLPEALAELKRYLESQRADARPLADLVLTDPALTTPEGLRRVMPCVVSAETIEASTRRRATGAASVR